MEKFDVADIVQLRSGGPKMSVQNPSVFDGLVEACWFAGAKLEKGKFKPESLRKLPEEDPR